MLESRYNPIVQNRFTRQSDNYITSRNNYTIEPAGSNYSANGHLSPINYSRASNFDGGAVVFGLGVLAILFGLAWAAWNRDYMPQNHQNTNQRNASLATNDTKTSGEVYYEDSETLTISPKYKEYSKIGEDAQKTLEARLTEQNAETETDSEGKTTESETGGED